MVVELRPAEVHKARFSKNTKWLLGIWFGFKYLGQKTNGHFNPPNVRSHRRITMIIETILKRSSQKSTQGENSDTSHKLLNLISDQYALHVSSNYLVTNNH